MRGGRVYKTGGREKSIQPGANSQRIFAWEMPPGLFGIGRDPDGDCTDAAPTVSVTLGVQLGLQANPAAPGQLITFPDGVHVDWSDAFLHVVWGSSSDDDGGSTDGAEMDVDLINGTSFSLVARDAQFYVSYPIPSAPDPGNLVQPVIDVSISVGIGDLGNGAGARSARRTVKVGALNSGATSGVFAIPRFAHAAVLLTRDATAGQTFQQLRAPVAGADLLAVSTIQKQETQSVPIYTGARGFDLIDTTQGGSAGNAVMFYLAPS